MAPSPLDDENAPLYTVGQVAEMLAVKQAFLRRVDDLQVVSPQRSAGGQRRYTRFEIRVIQQVVTMADEGITLQAIRRIISLEQQLADIASQLAEVTRHRDELSSQLAGITRHRDELSSQLAGITRHRDELARRLTEPRQDAR
jgi:MerR family transcriptional regulator, heat shock protein HspR